MSFFSKLGDGLKMQVAGGHTSDSRSPEVDDTLKDDIKLPSNPIQIYLPQHDSTEGSDNVPNQSNDELLGIDPAETSISLRSIKSSNGSTRNALRSAVWGRTSVSICIHLFFYFFSNGPKHEIFSIFFHSPFL